MARRARLLPGSLPAAAAAVALATVLLAPACAAPPRPAPQAAAAQELDPDAQLIAVFKDLAANRLGSAQQKIDALVLAYPNFHLAHLIRGDLLLMHTRPVAAFGAASGGSEERLKNLRAEAMQRLRSLRERPNPDLIPRALLKLREDQKYAFVVDARRSRLYVYENRAGVPHLVTDYYVSQGKLGVNKVREGDQKTPLGVYYITSRLPREKLPDFYGAGALPISFPNEWDRVNGRGGSGIWLHGTPSDSYSRPPLSSDGCVVLTNPDLQKLSSSAEVGKTPVIISEQVEWVTREKWEEERLLAARLLDGWRKDVESRDAARLMADYSSRFKTDKGETLETWFGRQKQWLGSVPSMRVDLREVSFFLYPGQEQLIVATFTQDAQIGKNRHSVRKRQYWAREGTHWKIVAENSW